MPDITDVLKRLKPREKLVTLYLAGDEVAEVERLEAELARLNDGWQPTSLGSANPKEKLAKQIAAARERIAKSAVDFRLRALGDKAWSDLVAAHPSDKRDEAWDPTTFPAALIAACCVDPAMTVEQVHQLFDGLNFGQREALTSGALEVNGDATAVPFSISASAILQSIAEK
ncbi:hypothetical protein GCM10010406_21050 [Streptomyces thermolineatus]|uniref:Uncharacterized protein n=1 Tax=Streptomyces thermolineatus TaxID=44033 RepID=A0ABN3LKM4_9ACTN